MKRGIYRSLWAGAMIFIWFGWGLGATKVYLPHDPQIQSNLTQVQSFTKSGLKDKLGLAAQEDLKLLRQTIGPGGVTHLRYHQRFNGIPDWGHPLHHEHLGGQDR